ncbi:alpha/beta fold hydrolase [Actinomycetospora cinnamomea]|uniref:Pimeloyl-ACP methyl ester carboxylesterase n=1 Tax=Actinomycetospora cinnamomea TaxID=663609 RepID=A0A2U1F6G2_9PSEU|nr:alpha/beta hydrolase [Actinomycetospora cinnamomea]PVZ07771.1 pimeloyl-ACP methyl ester carboxylesterase [Actinomycetospora cinnamomea]
MREEVDRFTAPDGTRLRVADSGTTDGDPALVLVHGWSQDLRSWDRVVDDLRRGGVTTRILRHDHRGHGGSDAAAEGTATIGTAADDLAALLAERVPDGPLVLAGHSMGGMTLMALAERHPQLVEERVVGAAFVATASDDMDRLDLGLPGRRGRLVARGEHVLVPLTARLGHRAPAGEIGDVGRAGGPSHRARATAMAPAVRALVFGRRPRPADVLSVAEQALAAHPPSVAAFRASIGEHRRREALATLRTVPSVVLVGDRDRLCPQHHARAIADALPDARIVLLPGAGHMINLERATEVAAHLAGLVAGPDEELTTVIPQEEPVRAEAVDA